MKPEIKEYKLLMNGSAKSDIESRNPEEDDANEKMDTNKATEETNQETGETPDEEQEENLSEDVQDGLVEQEAIAVSEDMKKGALETPVEKDKVVKAEDSKPAKQMAMEKLEKEMKDAKDRNFAEPVIAYLLKRCKEDEGLAQDVVQEHKTWEKCFDYTYSQARKQSKGNSAFVRDDVVYEWAEDYYRKDDKVEEQKKAAAKDKTAKAARLSPDKDKKAEKPAPAKEEKPKEQAKPKKNGKEMEGQLDMFPMMGM